MACNCGKRTAVARQQARLAAKGEVVPSGARWWFAVPPKNSPLEPQMFRSIQEARAVARKGGYGWSVEGRTVEITDGV